MNYEFRPKKARVNTTIDSDIYKWIKSQTSFSNWVETQARNYSGVGITPQELREIQHSKRFFASKVVELQAENRLKDQEIFKIRAKIDRLERKLLELAGMKNNGSSDDKT